MARKRLGLALVVALVVLGVAVWAGLHYQSTRQANAKPTDYYPKAESGKGLAPSNTSAPNGSATTAAPIPTSSAPKISADSKIVITAPTQGSVVKDGTTISGTANVGSGTLYYRLKGGQSGQLADGQISITLNQTTAYTFKLGFTNSVSKGGDQGEIEVYTLGSNGTESSIASVAVSIQE